MNKSMQKKADPRSELASQVEEKELEARLAEAEVRLIAARVNRLKAVRGWQELTAKAVA
jgi:hypothetical protein